MDFYSVLKVISLMATGFFGIIGVFTKYKHDNGKVTVWGKIAVVGVLLSTFLSLALYGLESVKATKGAVEAKYQYEETTKKLDVALSDSNRLLKLQRLNLDKSRTLEGRLMVSANDLEVIARESRDIQVRQADSFAVQQSLQESENHIHLWELRTSLPLTPLTIFYVQTFSMDRPEFRSYVERLKARIGEDLKRSPTVDEWDLGGDLLPDALKEPQAYRLVERSYVTFIFSDGKGRELVSFLCAPPERSFGADFKANQFRLSVTCEGLDQLGSYTRLSSLDLIGTILTWKAFVDIPDEDGEPYAPMISLIQFVFPYAPHNLVPLEVPEDGTSSIKLTADMLDLRTFESVARTLGFKPPSP